jgi:hypothetical protein
MRFLGFPNWNTAGRKFMCTLAVKALVAINRATSAAANLV